MKILIKVTRDILIASRGCQKKTMDCVIARAVREIFPRASVLGHTILLDCPVAGSEYDLRELYDFIELPEEAYQLIRQFDQCSTDEDVLALPLIRFEVSVPSGIIDKIGIGEAYRILSESKTLELVQP